jgi:hypothetical protein
MDVLVAVSHDGELLRPGNRGVTRYHSLAIGVTHSISLALLDD